MNYIPADPFASIARAKASCVGQVEDQMRRDDTTYSMGAPLRELMGMGWPESQSPVVRRPVSRQSQSFLLPRARARAGFFDVQHVDYRVMDARVRREEVREYVHAWCRWRARKTPWEIAVAYVKAGWRAFFL